MQIDAQRLLNNLHRRRMDETRDGRVPLEGFNSKPGCRRCCLWARHVCAEVPRFCLPGRQPTFPMATKKTHHKSKNRRPRQNRFRFETFASRIDCISIDLIRKVGGYTGAGPDANSSWFELSLREWQELNCTTPFKRFCDELRPLVGTLPQLLFYKKDIAGLLCRCLKDDAFSLAWKPISNLAAMLSKDLAEEYYAHFLDTLDALLHVLCVSDDVDAIESAFSSVMFLFKGHIQGILKDFKQVYAFFLHLVSKRAFLAKFAAQALAYVIKKADGGAAYVQEMASSIDSKDVGVFVSDVLVGAVHDDKSGRLRSCAKQVILATYAYPNLQTIFLPSLLLSVGHSAPLWKVVTDKIQESIGVLIRMVAIRKGAKLPPDSCIGLLSAICALPQCTSPLVQLLAFTLRSAQLETVLKARGQVCTLLASLDASLLFEFVLLTGMLAIPSSTFELLQLDGIVCRHLSCPSPAAVAVLLQLKRRPEIGIDAFLGLYDFGPSCLADSNFAGTVLPLISLATSDLGRQLRQVLEWPEDAKAANLSLWLTLVQLTAARSTFEEDKLYRHADQPAVLRLLKHTPYPSLLLNLLHPSAELRRLSLERLPSSRLVEAMIRLEGAPADLASYRERLLMLRQLSDLAAKSQREDEVELFSHFLLGQLHVNLSLLWPETIRVIGGVIEKGEPIFARVFSKVMKQVSHSRNADTESTLEPTPSVSEYEVDDESIHRLPLLEQEIQRVLLRGPGFPLVKPTCTLQPLHWVALLRVLAAHPLPSLDDELERMFVGLFSSSPSGVYTDDFVRVNQRHLAQWLAILERLKSGNAELVSILYGLISLGDPHIQSLALDALLASHDRLRLLSDCRVSADPKSVTWKSRMKSLLDDRDFKDTIIAMASDDDAIPLPEGLLFDLLARLLYGLVISRGKTGSVVGSGARRDPARSRRSAIFGALTGLSWWAKPTFGCFVANMLANPVDGPKKQVGFLTVLECVFSFGIADLSTTTYALFFDAIVAFAGSPEKRVRHLGWQRLLQFTRLSIKQQLSMPDYTPVWSKLLIPRIPSIDNELASASDSALLDFLLLCAQDMPTFFALSPEAPHHLWSKLIALLGRPSCSLGVANKIIDFVDGVHDKRLFSIDSLLMSVLVSRLGSSTGRLLVRVVNLIRRCATQASLQDMPPAVNALAALLALPNSKCSESVKAGILDALAVMAGLQVPHALHNTVCSLLRSMHLRAARQAAVSFFAFDEPLFLLLSGLESWIRVKLEEEPDYESRQRTIKALEAAELSDAQWTAILSVLMHQLTLEDLSLRSHAAGAVSRFLERPGALSAATSIIYPSIKATLRASSGRHSETIRAEHMALLQQLIVRFPSAFSQLHPLLTLGHGGEEASFFYNIYHLQKHRRARAIRRLAEVVESADLSKTLLQDVLIPTLMPFAIPRPNQSPPLDGVIQQDALNTLALLLAHLPSNAFFARLTKIISLVGSDKHVERAIVKLVPLAIGSLKDDVSNAFLEERLLPTLLRLWNGKADLDTLVTRIPIAVGIGRLLSRLSVQMERNLPALLTSLAQALKAREREDVRDAARRGLEAIFGCLGPSYLPLIVQILLSVINDSGQGGSSGYQRHVMLCVISSLVVKMESLDWPTAEHVLQAIIWDGALGKLAAEKSTSEWTGKLREVRSQRSYEAIERIVTLIPLESLQPFFGELDQFRTSAYLEKVLSSTFSAIVKRADVREMCYSTADSPADIAPLTGLVLSLLNRDWSIDVGLRLLAFALKHRILVEPTVATIQAARFNSHAALLKPITDKLVSLYLGNPSRATMGLVLTSFTALIRWIVVAGHLLELQVPAILARAFELVVSADYTVQALRLIAMLVRDAEVQLEANQLKALIQLTRSALQDAQLGDATSVVSMNQPQLCFTLARSLISRRIVLLEVFELMQTVSEGVVIAPNASARDQCRRLLLQFLMEYPMANAKVLDFIHMLLRNLRYEHASGRLSVCTLLGAIVQRVRPELVGVDAWCLALVERMANEEDAVCLAAIGSLARSMIGRLGNDTVFLLFDKWSSPSASQTGIIRKAAWRLLKWIGLGFIDAGHAKLVLRRMPVYNSEVAVEVMEAFVEWIKADARFVGHRLPLSEWQMHPHLLISLYHQYAKHNQPVDVDYLVDKFSAMPSDMLVETLLCLKDATLLRRLIGIAKKNEGEACLEAAIKYASSVLLQATNEAAPLALDSAASIASIIHYCRSQTRCTESIELLDRLLQEQLGPIAYADLAKARVAAQRAKRVARKTELGRLAVQQPDVYAQRKLRRNQKKDEKRRVKRRQLQADGRVPARKKRKAEEGDLADLF